MGEGCESQGATVLTGGIRIGTVLEPTVLADVKPHMKVVCQEVFAPIVSVIPFETEEDAVRMANDSDFGLQAGVFLRPISTVPCAWRISWLPAACGLMKYRPTARTITLMAALN